MGDPEIPRKPALVVSHERSGTHFLMNTLALNFGYRPYTDLDERPGFDPRSTPQILGFLLAGWPFPAVIKSHHPVEIFPLLPRLAEIYEIFYAVRDPRDVLLSFRRYIAEFDPGNGPVTSTVGEFLRAAPPDACCATRAGPRRPWSTAGGCTSRVGWKPPAGSMDN